MNARRNGWQRELTTALCLLLFLLPAQVATACSWDYLIWMIHSKDADPLYRFVRDGKAGYIDRSGKIVIKPVLGVYGNGGSAFENGLLNLSVSDETRYMDKTGKIVINKNYSSAWDFSDGLAAVLPEDGGKWGFIDRSGEFAISPRFVGYPDGYPYPFSEGLAMIEVGKKYGYIDHSGEFVIQPKLLWGTSFQDGMARVVVEGPCLYFKLDPCPDSRILGEAVEGKQVPMCKFTFIDKSGSVISNERYDEAKDFSEGLAPVKVGEKWGFIDKKGQMVVEPKFDEAEPFSDGLAKVKQGELFGYIDRTGASVIPPQFEYADDFAEGLAAVGIWNDKDAEFDEFYYINKHGKQAIAERFALASNFFKGLAHVKLKSKQKDDSDSNLTGTFAYIDSTGRKIFTYVNKGED